MQKVEISLRLRQVTRHREPFSRFTATMTRATLPALEARPTMLDWAFPQPLLSLACPSKEPLPSPSRSSKRPGCRDPTSRCPS
ncbi:MAG TPA: hypothetical protein VGO71_11875 [Baekduia sp.]|jgi:hypothetical protein|nr:hypothetical protein [Baekduia sp.]